MFSNFSIARGSSNLEKGANALTVGVNALLNVFYENYNVG